MSGEVELLAALDALGAGDVLVIAKLDRLGRSVLNVAMIERLVERKRARIVSAAGEGTDDDGPTSVLGALEADALDPRIVATIIDMVFAHLTPAVESGARDRTAHRAAT